MGSWLAEVARSKGNLLRFDHFMHVALYHPVHGYYSAHVEQVGPGGDFTTSPSLSPLLGRALANWLRSEARLFHERKLRIIELGGGTGHLAEAVLQAIPPWRPCLYSIVEISPLLERKQRERLRRKNVQWYSSVQAALNAQKGPCLVISNEFVDAFPCRRFRCEGSTWSELFFRLNGDAWEECFLPASILPESTCFQQIISVNQQIEVHDAYRIWLHEFAESFQSGALLTIDYGGAAAEIFRRAPRGTIRGFFRHQRVEGLDIYRRPGRQDITADVNFNDLQLWGSASQIETVSYQSQSDFIRQWAPRSLPRSHADCYLLDPSGPGQAFKVLHQRRRASAA